MQTALTVLPMLLVFACGWLLRSSIVNPLKTAIGVARRLAKGDLAWETEVTSKDEARQLLGPGA